MPTESPPFIPNPALFEKRMKEKHKLWAEQSGSQKFADDMLAKKLEGLPDVLKKVLEAKNG